MDLIKFFMEFGRFEMPAFDVTSDAATKEAYAKANASRRGWGYRRLNRHKVVNGYRFQLHATRGWKCVGRVT